MRVLVVGSGGREHALVRTLLRDEHVGQVHAAPGNPGMEADGAAIHTVDVRDANAIAELAQSLHVDLAVIGPEIPLVNGAVDELRRRGIAAFGPTAAAAQIEGSKSFAKSIMAAANVPTARSHTCTSIDEVQSAIDEFGAPFVIKDDGLAAGKGVVVTQSTAEALDHARACLAAGSRVVVEEFLSGPEVSLFAVTDGMTVVPLIPAQDFKRVYDNDEGPNTGGMGAYAPLPWLNEKFVEQVQREVLQPVVDEMRERGEPFTGLLYAGLIVTDEGIKVIEFNARFGDPETQVVLALLESSLADLLMAAATKSLDKIVTPSWHQGFAVTVVIAAQGYPESPVVGDVITGLSDSVLHAGTKRQGEDIVSAGGRVLCALGTGKTLEDARDAAYESAQAISLRGSHFRTDIAAKAATSGASA